MIKKVFIFLCIRIFIFILLILAFGWQVLDQTIKFVDKKTTMTSRIDERTSDYLPTIGFCFGFKSEYNPSKLLITRNIQRWREYQTLERMNSTFRQSTFDIEDVLKYMSITTTESFASKLKLNIGLNRLLSSNIEVMEVYSEFGRCYSVFLENIFFVNLTLLFLLNISSTTSAHVFNSRGGQQGLIDNYWSIESKNLKLQPSTEYTFGLSKRVRKILNINHNCMPEEEVAEKWYNHIKCIEMFSLDLLNQRLLEKGMSLCWIPQADFFIKQMNKSSIEACQTRESMEAIYDEISYVMLTTIRSIPSCPEPCTIDHISITERQSPILGGNDENFTEIYFYWENFDVLVEEEILLLDFNAIVSAIGGSLGLFLGFSCLGFLLKLLSKIEFLTSNSK